MGFLTESLSSQDRSPTSNMWYGPMGHQSLSGVDVNAVTAFNYSAVWAASRLISDTISTLPKFLYKRDASGKSKAFNHPTFKAVNSEPNPEQGGVNYFAQQVNFVVNWGNCYAEVVRDRLGRVVQTWPIHPSRIPARNIKRNRVDPNIDVPGGDTGELVYLVSNNNGTHTAILKRNMFHLPGILSEDGITGKGVIAHAAESIGMGIATERFGASFFGNGAAPTIILSHPHHLGEDAAKNIRASWKQNFDGPDKTNGVMVVEEDMKIERLTIPPEQAQYISTRQFNITEIARWYNLPVHLLREMSKSSFNNIESENLHFIIISIMPWLVRWEDEMNRQLLIEPDKGNLFFKFQLQGMLRGDMASRATFYKEMWFMGVFSINDILELEDRNTIGPQGDVRFVQAQMIPIEMAGKQPEPKPAPLSVDALLPSLMSAVESREAIAVDSVGESRDHVLSRIDDMSKTLSGHMLPADYFEKHFTGLRSEVIKISDKLDVTNESIEMLRESIMPVSLSGTSGDMQLKMLAAAEKMFRGGFGRLLRKEAKGARWAAEKPKEFMSRLDSWFNKHRETYRSDELSAAFDAMEILGVTCDIEEFAKEQIELSYASLIEKSGEATTETLGVVIDELAVEWETTKIDSVTETIFTGE